MDYEAEITWTPGTAPTATPFLHPNGHGWSAASWEFCPASPLTLNSRYTSL